MEIKKVGSSEAEKVYEVFSSVLKDGFPEYSSELIDFFLTKDFPLSSWISKLESKEITVFGAIENEKIVGFLVTDKLYGGVSCCTWLLVLKEFREKGIGTKLISEWEKEIKKIGGHKLILITQEEMNRGFYKKLRFSEEGFEEKSWFGLDCWKFGKIIGKPKPDIFLK